MKRLALMGLILLVALFVSATVHAKPVVNEEILFCTDVGLDSACDPDGLFTTKFWKEKFFGGGPGAEGNVLMAKGKGFMLQNVVLHDVAPYTGDCGPEPDACCGTAEWEYVTHYEGGMLTLNSKGPWLDKGMLKAKGLTATNYSRGRGEDGTLEFCLVIEGTFRNAPYTFNAVATFDATLDPYQFKVDDEGNPVFQRGYDFNAVIEILPLQ